MLLPVSSYRAREVTRSVSVLPGLELSLLCSSAIKAKSWLLPQGLLHACCSLCLEYLPGPGEHLSSEWGGCSHGPWTAFSHHIVPGEGLTCSH